MVEELETGSLDVRSEQDVVLARQLVRKLALQAGFSLVEQTKMVTAASELARNTVIYGGGGNMLWAVVRSGPRSGVRLTFLDEGPGIADIELAMTDGWSSGSGLGLGLSGAKRLVNDFEISSKLGHGTSIMIIRWK